MRRYVSTIWQGLLDLFFPCLCEHCLDVASSAVPLCWRCVRRLERVAEEGVDRVVSNLAAPNDAIQLKCLWYFDRDGPLRDVVHALKYQNRPWYGHFLGRAIAEGLEFERPIDAVVPMPLHPIRLLERGYNQAGWIARQASRELKSPLREELLHRAVPTRTQTNLSPSARWDNVRDAFEVTPLSVETDSSGLPEHVLLVDDVVTTGATAVSAALKLVDAGVASVTIAAAGLARA